MFARPSRRLAGPALLFAVALASARADGPADNLPDKVRPVPPKGIDLPAADAAEIDKGLAELQGLIKAIGKHELLPDVEIYEKAVRYAVQYKEVFDAKGIPAVKKVLAAGLDRAKQLKDGKYPWIKQTGYVVLGYRSEIDGSAQPYGLYVPAGYDFAGKEKHRLDIWWHGRGETLSEVNFIANQQNAAGIIPVPGQFILFPYGRYCNANRFAGEMDTMECFRHASQGYRFDMNRLVARGFSMGGAACWQFAVHHPSIWCAAAPGAGFSETPEFLRVFQNERVDEAPWYEKKLWRMYNATDYAANLFNVPTVAYSGEIDKQKQAADEMEKAMAKEGLKLAHIIGPKTAHSYEKAAKAEVNKRIDAIVEKGRNERPNRFRFTTYTLKYQSVKPILITRLGKHWERAKVDGELKGEVWHLTTENVTGLAISHPPTAPEKKMTVVIDGTELPGNRNQPSEMYSCYRRVGGKWEATPLDPERGFMERGLVKMPDLQGPIDDAFMSSFMMVAPSGKPLNEKVGAWAAGEMKHAVEHWRKQFRGDAIVKKDTEITDADIGSHNLVLWGDPSSNAVLAKIADKLPIKWTATGVKVGDKTYDAGTHVPVLIFPNPLYQGEYNGLFPTQKYVVINSGFTYREYDYLNNARQVPKLPDYAVIDTTTPPNSRYPGKVVRAGFFGEKWELLPDDGK